MNYKKLILTVAFAFAAALFFGSQQEISAATLTVDDNRIQCPNAGFTSIQAAINASSAGDNIRVCPGTYTELVRITKPFLTVFSSVPLQAVIQAPADLGDLPYAIVRIDGAFQTTLRGFTITGPLPDALFCSVDLRAGISVIGGASATIRDNHVTEIHSADPALRGCQNGFAITVGRGSQGQSGSATILRNTIDRYQKGGIYVDGAGSSATIQDNEIRGVGDDPIIAQNGIQISREATAEIKNNEVVNHRYSGPADAGASGIIVFLSGELEIINNRVNRNDFGILTDTIQNPRIERNTTSSNTFDGISLYTTTGAIIDRNISRNNGFDGIYVFSDSTNNLLVGNTMLGNDLFDAEDISSGSNTGGTANSWFNNNCVTDNRGGAICGGNGGGSEPTVNFQGDAQDNFDNKTKKRIERLSNPKSNRHSIVD